MVQHYINQRKPSKKENVMDDITHGQWSKNHYDDDYYDDSILNDDDDDYDNILDPYITQNHSGK
jgi:hypothetical protein